MRRILLAMGVAALAATIPAGARAADSGPEIAKKCAACHQMTGPADDSLKARQTRKGPPLFYAGNKFREDWLVKWLQAPSRIRPAGDFPPAHVKPGDKSDVIDAATLPKHPALPPNEAKAVAGYLMTLKPNDALIAKEHYTPGRVSPRMGAMDFVKFKGCGACHMDTPKYGGVSGPELYTAWQRLQPAFITSYIHDPTAWEPRSIMPVKHLQEGAIHKLENYLKAIGEKRETPK